MYRERRVDRKLSLAVSRQDDAVKKLDTAQQIYLTRAGLINMFEESEFSLDGVNFFGLLKKADAEEYQIARRSYQKLTEVDIDYLLETVEKGR